MTSMLRPLWLNLILALVPIVVAGGCIALIKRSVLALFVAVTLLACFLFGSSFFDAGSFSSQPFLELLPTYQAQVGGGLASVLLLSAGVALLNGGPSGGFARRWVQLIPHPDWRLFAGIVAGTLTGFGSSAMAAQFLADLFVTGEEASASNDPSTGAARQLALAPVLCACTFGSLLIPVSVWWVYFGQFALPEPGAKPSGFSTHNVSLLPGPHGWFPVMPVLFCLAVVVILVRNQRRQRAKQIKQRDVRFLLRRAIQPPTWREGISCLLFFGLVMVCAFVIPMVQGENTPWDLPEGVIVATLLAAAWWLRQELHSNEQTLWPLPKSEAQGSEKAANALAQMRAVSPTVLAARRRGEQLQVLPDEAAAWATHLVFRRLAPERQGFWSYQRSTLSRLLLIVGRQWELWERGLASGLGAALVLMTALVFKIYYRQYLQVLDVRLDFSLGHPGAWGGNFFGCLLVIVILGGVGGYVIGTSFGTFALVFALIGPSLLQLQNTSPVAAAYAELLVGGLIILAATINSCSLQADNVNVAAGHLGVSTSMLSKATYPILLEALAYSSIGLLLPYIPALRSLFGL